MNETNILTTPWQKKLQHFPDHNLVIKGTVNQPNKFSSYAQFCGKFQGSRNPKIQILSLYCSLFCMQYSSWSSGCSSGHTHSPQASGLWSLSHPSQSQFIFYPVAAYIHIFVFIFTFIFYAASIYISHQTKVNLSFILNLPSIDLFSNQKSYIS